MADSPFLYPNVSSIPGQNRINTDERLQTKKTPAEKSDFDRVLDENLNLNVGDSGKIQKNLEQVKQPLKFSAHASQRLQERKIHLDSATMLRVTDAIDKAEAKGIEDTLVLTADAALIVNVKNRTVITAMDKGSLQGNVFTNIDGAVIV